MKSASSPGATSPHDHTGSTESQGAAIYLMLQTWLQLCLQISLWHQKFLDIMEQCILKGQKMEMSFPWFSKRIVSAIRKHNTIIAEQRKLGALRVMNAVIHRPEIIMPQLVAIILFLNSFKILLLFPKPLLLFLYYSQRIT